MGMGLLIKKGNKVVVMMDQDQNLFPSTASFGASFHNIMSFSTDVVVVINNYYHLRGRHLSKSSTIELHNSQVGRAYNECNGSAIRIYQEQKTSA